MNTRYQVLQLLAPGGFHSGQTLASALGITRAAVWKHIQALQNLGVQIDRVPRRGYRLKQPLELLCQQRIRHAAGIDTLAPQLTIEIHHELDSTNRHLMTHAQQGAVGPRVCLAEYQSQGRGRRGRPWISPFGCNLYMSVLWHYTEAPARLGTLPLAIAVAATRTLGAFGAESVQIKWPNDLVWRHSKVGGILVELAGDPTDRCHIVCGIGLNVDMTHAHGADIDQPWTGLNQITGRPLSRNQLAGQLLRELLIALQHSERDALAGYIEEWRKHDAYANQPAKLLRGEQHWEGIARGIDDDGNLLMEIGGTLERFHSGDISLRRAR